MENVQTIHNRLDTAIDKLTDVSTSIKQMLAVHEEKISRQEQTDEVIFDKLRETSIRNTTVHTELSKRNPTNRKTITTRNQATEA